MTAKTIPQYLGISAAARVLGVSEDTLRRYSNLGIVSPQRDSSNRRLFTAADIDKAKAYIDRRNDAHAD